MKLNRKFSEGAETHHKKVFDRFTVQGSGIGEFLSKMSSELMDAGTYAWIVIIIFFLLFTAVRNRFTEQKLSSNNNKPTDFSIHKNESFFACFLGPLNRNHYVFMCSSALCSIHFRLCTTFNEKQKKTWVLLAQTKKLLSSIFPTSFFRYWMFRYIISRCYKWTVTYQRRERDGEKSQQKTCFRRFYHFIVLHLKKIVISTSRAPMMET